MYKNDNNLPLSLAVFLAHDEYPDHSDPNTISATTLLKPIKQIVLGMRVPKGNGVKDISGNIASVFGTAIHNGIERAWCSDKLQETLALLGYPSGMVKNVIVNPKPEDIEERHIVVYTEFRTSREFLGYTVTGEFDFLADGMLRDFKTTGTYTYIAGTNDEKYPLQGSIYRWLNPDKVTEDVMAIDFIFTDWSALAARTQKNYPPLRMMAKNYELKSLKDTERFIADKLNLITTLRDSDEIDIPACTNEDLWVAPSKFKYYKNPDKLARATRVYDTSAEAYAHQRKDGGMGVVLEHKGEVKACKYCDAIGICQQAQQYINSGALKI